ncbi:MAG TPA: PBP1A family penicillin-binding protein [Candidatus Saccharimonadia bacterium]|nr:PBP1A family penicillin-binding protein [Candidatus Saccharimonadia bacterium]
MARSKHHKRKKQQKRQQHGFYESLSPALLNLPTGTPWRHQWEQMTTTAADWGETAGRTTAQWGGASLDAVRTWLDALETQAATWGRRLAAQLVAQAPTARRLSRIAATAITAGWDYGRAATSDSLTGLGQLGRAAWGRRARSLYLAIISAGLLASVVAVSAATTSTIALYAHDISSPAVILSKKKTGTTILDRNGQVLYQSYGAQGDQTTPLGQIPQSLKDATLAAEDPSFYDHQGFSWRATARAAWVDLTHADKVEGGSTLTQQLVKNAILTSNKTFERKYQEVILSMELERKYSKDQILEMYLSETDYGQGSRGVAAAAQTYFHKPLSQLTLAQSALIAGLPLGTNRFDPNANLAAATNRRNYVLDRMAALGKITPTQAKTAEAEPIVAYPKTITIQAPHFVFYVLDQLRDTYGQDAVENGGLTVRTTLDLGKQTAAQQIVADQVNKLAAAHHTTNGGLIAIEPTTGDIITMVGSVDYNAPGFGAVNVTLSDLQPGSSFKPIAYVTAFSKGWNGSTQVDDAPLSLPNGDGTQYVPQNYDGKFRGQVTLRRALSNSLNIPAIKVLQYAGLDTTIDMAHNLGITTLNDRSRYGLSLVLGGGEVRPIDLATVYGTFANGGTKVEPRAILKVSDRYGKDLTKNTQPASKQALDPRYAAMITSILSDNNARIEEFGANSPLKLNRPAAAKTGTTNDFRDNWTVGYTPNLVTAVWVGNNDHSAMVNVDGITGAAPIWHDYMEMASAGVPAQNFAVPTGLSSGKVCAADGGLANPWDTNTYDELWPTDQPLTRKCGSAMPIIIPLGDGQPALPNLNPAAYTGLPIRWKRLGL